MHRIFFDANAGTHEDGYFLWFDKSLEDISKISASDLDGKIVIIYMPHEMELKAVLRYDSQFNCWKGFPVD